MPDGGISPRPDVTMFQGTVLTKVDALLNEKDHTGKFRRREAFLSTLESLGSFEEDRAEAYLSILKSDRFAVDGQILLDDFEESFLRRWFTRYSPGGASFWPDLLPLEPTMRSGTIETIKLGQRENLPIVSYWLQVGNDFNVFWGLSLYQVTRVIVTPPAL